MSDNHGLLLAENTYRTSHALKNRPPSDFSSFSPLSSPKYDQLPNTEANSHLAEAMHPLGFCLTSLEKPTSLIGSPLGWVGTFLWN